MKLIIPSPCPADWANMTKEEGGRFCDQCEKKVHDFSKSTKEEIITNLQGEQKNICARIPKPYLDNSDHYFTETSLMLPKKSSSYLRKPLLSFVLGSTIFIGVSSSGKAHQITYIPDVKNDHTQVIQQGEVCTIPSKEKLKSHSDSLSLEEIKINLPQVDITGDVFLTGFIINNEHKSEDDTPVYSFYNVAEKPEFPGGMHALIDYFVKGFSHKNACVPLGYEEKIYIECVIKSDGCIGEYDIKRAHNVSSKMKKEILRLIAEMPLWTPGRHNGENVDVRFVIPFKIKYPE